MTYVVLARKYRPRSFAQMVGQEHVVQALTNALEQQRLHHAYLFTGTRGIGKTTVSRILAKSLNCTGPDGTGGITSRPCGVCSACTEIDADRYIDYIEMDAASNRGIDEIRELLERAAYKPSVGRFKVFMIDEAHQLTKESFNALLKTLEEPPEYLKFVLATTDPDKMLPTVLSRCLQFNLRPMAPEVVRDHLQHVLEAESVAADAGALRLLSRAARGSMRDALSLTDQAIAYGGGQLTEDVVRTMLGAVDRNHANALVRALAARDGRALLASIDALRGLGLSAAGTLEEISTLLQQMAVEQAVPGALDEHDPDTAEARELSGLLPRDETQLLYSIVLQGRSELSLASDEYGALTMVLLRLLAFPSSGPAAQPPPMAVAPAPARAVQAGPPVALSPASSALQAPRDARTSAVPRPMPQRSPAVSATEPMPTPSTAAALPALRTTRPSAPSASEPPPWLDDVPPPDDDGVATVLSRPAAARATDVREAVPAAGVSVALEPATNSTGTAVPNVAPDTQRGPASNAGLPSTKAMAVPPVAPIVEVERTPLGDRWAGLVAQLLEASAITALVRELAMQAELCEVLPQDGPELWRLKVERETLRAPALRDKLQAALATVMQPAPRLDLLADVPQDSPARREAVERDRRQRHAEHIIRNDPLVQDLMAQFKTARLVPGSIKPA